MALVLIVFIEHDQREIGTQRSESHVRQHERTMNIQIEDRKVHASDKCLESSTDKAEAAEDRQGRSRDVEISLGERRTRMILALLCAKQREEGGDILDPACDGRANRTCGHRTWTLGGRHWSRVSRSCDECEFARLLVIPSRE
jgi:hypothetical protein